MVSWWWLIVVFVAGAAFFYLCFLVGIAWVTYDNTKSFWANMRADFLGTNRKE